MLLLVDFFSFKSGSPFSEGKQNNFDRVVSLESVPIPLYSI